MKQLPIFRILFMSVVILLVGWGGKIVLTAQKKEIPKHQPEPIQITANALKAHYQEHQPTVHATGRIEASATLDLATKVTGQALAKDFRLREGFKFSKGDTILILDDAETRNNLKSTNGNLMTTIASILPDIQSDWPQQAAAWQKFLQEIRLDYLPPLPDANGTLKIFLARNKVFSLYFTASNLQIQIQDHVLKAPFWGEVISSTVTPGTLVRSGTTIAKLNRLDGLELALAIPSSDARYLKAGNSVMVYVNSRQDSVQAQISRISAIMDEATQSQKVYVQLSHNASLGIMAGAYGEVALKSRTLSSVVRIPRSALFNGHFIHRIQNSRLKNIPVTIVRQDLDYAYVQEGLAEGDTVLSQAIPEAVVDMLVQPLFAEE